VARIVLKADRRCDARPIQNHITDLQGAIDLETIEVVSSPIITAKQPTVYSLCLFSINRS